MDNRINEIRRKISALRAEMVDVEAVIRDLVNQDRDCTDSALDLIGLRKDMTRLIGEWRAAGGGELLPNVRERVSLRRLNKDGKQPRVASRR
jgi:chorismate mutase